MRKTALFSRILRATPLALVVFFAFNFAFAAPVYNEGQELQCITDTFNGSDTNATFRARYCKQCVDTVSTTCELTIENGECFYSGECREGYVNPQGEDADLTCSAAVYTVKYMDENIEILPPTSYTYSVGATIDAIAEKTGYEFVGWCTDPELTNCAMEHTISTTDIGDKTYYASWGYVGCEDGYYFANETCNACEFGYTSNGATATVATDCYKVCTTDDIEHSTVVKGIDYSSDGIDSCTATSCATGWHLQPGLNVYQSVIGVTEAGTNYAAISDNGDDVKRNAATYGLSTINDRGAFVVDYGNKGKIAGQSSCSSRLGTDPWVGANDDYVAITENATEILPDSVGQYCYCRIDEYIPNSGNAQSLNSPWLFRYKHSRASSCASACADGCASMLKSGSRTQLSFRKALFQSPGILPTSCDIDVYNITFNLNSGDWESDTTVPENYTIESQTIILPEPIRDGYDFVGWYRSENLTGNTSTEIASGSTGDKTYWAKWYATSCDDGYYLDNGICNVCESGYTSNGATATSSADCYRFCTSADIAHSATVTGTVHYGDNVNVCEPLTCMSGYHMKTVSSDLIGESNTAICENDVYSITFVLNEGEWEAGVFVPEIYTIESQTISLPAPKREGYNFVGWYENANLTGNVVTQIANGSTGNKKFYAKWADAEFVCESQAWLHVGDNEDDKICLYDAENKPAAPRMAIETNNGIRYMMLSNDEELPMHKGSNKKMHIDINGTIYNVHDGSVGIN